MPDSHRPRKLAVLIDAENIPAKIADGLFEEIAKIGEASVRRIYGDFSSTNIKSWTAILPKHAMLPQQQFANTVGKNASDIALVIDAMDLLHSGRFDGFCLVSSDSDFTRLAARIREQGLSVYGFGEQKTPESFRQACLRFIYIENLSIEAPPAGVAEVSQPKALKHASDAVPTIRKAMKQLESDDGWVNLGPLGVMMNSLEPDFDSRTYGSTKLSDLIRKTGAFDVEKVATGATRARLKVIAKTPVAGQMPQKQGQPATAALQQSSRVAPSQLHAT